MNLLERLRERRALGARMLLPLLCTMLLGAFGCPCVMAADLGVATVMPQHEHRPFDPMGHKRGSHATWPCYTVRNAADCSPQAFPLKWELSHAPAITQTTLGATAPVPYRLARREVPPGAHAPPVRLNLRYCVLLN